MIVPLDKFFTYHADNGGKRITIWINGQLTTLNKAQFKRLICPFTLLSSETRYIISVEDKKPVVIDL